MVISKFTHRMLFFVLTLMMVLFYLYKQPQILAGNGKGWDGKYYSAMYNDFKNGEKSDIIPPFCKRVGLPYLASRINIPESKSFLYINLMCGFLATIFVFLTVSDKFTMAVSWFCSLPMIFYIFSPIRFPDFYPFTVDPPAIASLAIGVFFFSRKAYVISGLMLSVGVFFRESNVYYLYLFMIFALIEEMGNKNNKRCVFLLIVVGLGYFVLRYCNSIYDCDTSQIRVAYRWARIKLSDPLEILRMFAAISLTIAPFLYRIFILSNKKRFNIKYNSSLAYLGGFVLATAMAFVGGYDTTRIFYFSYPAYVVILATFAKNNNLFEVLCLSASGLIANKFINIIPEPETYLPQNDIFGWFSFNPEYAHISISAGIICYWIVCFFVIHSLSARIYNDKELDNVNYGENAK